MSVRLGYWRYRVGLVAGCCLSCMVVATGSAWGLAETPAWTVNVVSMPTNFAPGDQSGKDVYQVLVTNTGDAPSNGEPVTVHDALPSGLALNVIGVSGRELLNDHHWPLQQGEPPGPLSCSGPTCTYAGVVAAGDELLLTIPVDVELEAESSVTNLVTVSGGGAAEASASTPTTISSAARGFGIAPGSFAMGVSNPQAGAHADVTTSLFFNQNAEGSTEGKAKDIAVGVPAGFAGDPLAAPTCTEAQLDETTGFKTNCPPESQVGTITLFLGFSEHGLPPFESESRTAVVPVYDLQPLGNEVARLGFDSSAISSNLVFTVIPGGAGGYRLRATAPNIISGGFQLRGSVLTLWGVPDDSSHNLLRGTFCYEARCNGPTEGPVGEGIPASDPPEPFSSNPTGCEGPLTATLSVDTWQHREEPVAAETSLVGMTGCERLGFGPGLLVQPTSSSAEAPTGLNVALTLPQTYGNPVALATSSLKNTVVTLPPGMTVNPSAGAGLAGCTPAQYEAEALETKPGKGCPNESSLGTVKIQTPVLKEEVEGSVYLAQPYDNPFSEPGHPSGSLLALYVIAKLPARGLILKLAGNVIPNPVTGQLTTVFENNPQLPFDKFTLSFHPGQAAPLVMPPTCGSYEALGEFTSWSEPNQIVSGFGPSFAVTQGVAGGPCPSGGVPPFNPQVYAGSFSGTAGAYSPFYLEIARNDGEQEITRFSTVLPPGLSGNLSGIPFCPEAEIEAARTVTGTEELEHPSCPAASEIGHTLVGAGVGGVLAYTPGKVYLAGPYHGAPLSIVSITSATVGPFDLGTVVIRFALRINPLTAQVEVDAADSEPIPHIIRGIVVHVRDIHVYIDRGGFTLNPTSCEPMSIAATITGAGADFTNPADAVPVTIDERFEVTNCAALVFKPTFKVSTSGRTSREDGASLTVKIAFPHPGPQPNGQSGEANIAKVHVELPKSLPARLTTLQKACTEKQFAANPAGCPAESVVGHAKASTPILPVPLEGPAYFVSHGSAAFPELIMVLQGYGVTIQLHGETFISSKDDVTSSTFAHVPDAPVSSFELTLPRGKYSALAANGNLCQQQLVMPTTFTAQNGATLKQDTRLEVEGCSNTISVVSTKLSDRTLTLRVSVPGVGIVKASGKGLSSVSGSSGGRETIKIRLHVKRHGKTTVRISFKPAKGKGQSKTLGVRV
jgi:uncharacterized repeat protein (TIGR01451 family)